MFGDMDVDFASSPTTAQPSPYAETAPLSNVSELGDLVLTPHMSANAGDFFFLIKKAKAIRPWPQGQKGFYNKHFFQTSGDEGFYMFLTIFEGAVSKI